MRDKPEVDYTETYGRAIAISKSKTGRDHVTEGKVAHVEITHPDGLFTVYFRDDDASGGGIVSHNNHTIRYLD